MKTWPSLAIFCWSFCLAQAQVHAIYNLAGSSVKKTGLSSLNEDCLMEVLEQLSLDDLVVMAKTSRYYENMASNVFKRKYSNKHFINTKDPGSAFILPTAHSKIVQLNIESTIQILKTFGHMIQRLMVDSHKIEEENQLRKIHEYVGQYCSESLVEFHFLFSSENPLEFISNSFNKVEFVSFASFSNNPVKIGNDTIKITDIFPALKTLYISVIDLENQSCVNLVYPHLKELQLEIRGNPLESATTEDILLKNPQIQHLGMFPATLSMKRVNDILPNLQTLSVMLDDVHQTLDNVDEIRFKNVKRLTAIFPRIYPTNLVFNQLEEVQFGNRKFQDGWVEFFAKFPTIKKFNATIDSLGGEMDATVLQRLAVQLPNLTELGFAINSDFTKSHLVDFFQRNPNLLKIFLAISPNNFDNDLKREISEEFHICEELNGEGWGVVTVERKELN